MDDNVCGAYTQYGNGWCQLIYSECTEWRNAADTSAISWRKPGQSLTDVWEQISDADGQYCVSMYNPHSNSNCRQACMDDTVCGAYTQYGNGWCQLIASECTEWRTAADTSAISWRKPGQSLTAAVPDEFELKENFQSLFLTTQCGFSLLLGRMHPSKLC